MESKLSKPERAWLDRIAALPGRRWRPGMNVLADRPAETHRLTLALIRKGVLVRRRADGVDWFVAARCEKPSRKRA